MTQSEFVLTEQEFAQLGEGRVAYLKRVSTDDLARKFPDLPPMTPGIEVWGLFGAAGDPIVLSDLRAHALAGAQEHELETVTLQ